MDNVFYDVTVDLDEGEDTTYSLGASFPDVLITETSHTLRLTLEDSGVAYDLGTPTASTLKIKKNDSSGGATTLATGTLVTDGSDGKINFIVNKDLIPASLAAFDQSSDFPQILYFVTIEDADSKIQVRKLISIEDIDGTGSGSANPEAADFDYTPTTESDWTSWTDSGSAPTAVGGALDDVAQRLNEITGALTFKGTIAVAADFPTTADVENGYTYRVTATVTDNDVTKTNTGQSFIDGDEIAWNGTDWTELGNVAVNSVNGLTGVVVIGVPELDDVTLTAEAQGDILFRDATEFVNLAPGTAGKCLQTNGAGADPSWEVPSDTTKLPLAGGTMTGGLNMGNQILSAPLDPTAGTEVGDRDYNDARYAELSGATMTGALAMGNQTLSGSLDPTGGTHIGDRDYNDTRYNVVQIGVAASDETTALTTGTAKTTFRMPYAMTLTEVRANVNTAPTGSVITVDINDGGTTVLSTKLTIDATEKTSETAATPPVISDSALADDAEITIDIDGVGSTIAGAGLKVWLIGTRDL